MNAKDEMVCKPIDKLDDIFTFSQNPPTWSSLCKELIPHSKELIQNMKLLDDVSSTFWGDGPEPFCHFDPEVEDVRRHNEAGLPKTLLCHDMANGYHDDCKIDGTGKYDAYTFYNWAGIDIFCYFSHHLITIPPLSWINVGHAHGVKVIGTVITERADGTTFWEQMLKSDIEYKNFARALVAIAKTLKFDGWLLNVENKITKPDVLLEFVSHLHLLLHQELVDPLLIWYDSVTIEGHLNWQNALNSKNKAFFDACDGLFTNYSWSEEDVSSSAAVATAAGRLNDLYIGIDVWGRNFYGGGQLNVHQAVELAHRNGCSLAIFAPAWTHEALTMDPRDLNTVAMASTLNKYSHFLLRERALWDSIWKFLNTRVPNTLPFKTSFCRGQGKKRRLYGEVLSPTPWYNLRHMQYQPNSSHGPHGYYLSTIDNIMHISRQTIYKDAKGIMKYKIDNIHVVETEDSCTTQDSRESTKDSVQPEADSATELREPVNDAPSSSESKSWKTKIKDIVKQIMKYKPPREPSNKVHSTLKTEVNSANEGHAEKRKTGVEFKMEREEFGEETERDELEAFSKSRLEPSLNRLELHNRLRERSEKGHSLMQMSVHIKLGAHGKTRYGLAYVTDELECLEVYFDDSFVGGSCLKINPSDLTSTQNRFIKLFHCDFVCDDVLIVCVVTKHLPGFELQYLNTKLYMRNAKDEQIRVTLIGRWMPSSAATKPVNSSAYYLSLYPVNCNISAEFKQLQKYMLLNEPDFYVPTENAYGWTVRYYEVSLPGSRVSSINLETGLADLPILLGHVGVCARRRPASSHPRPLVR